MKFGSRAKMQLVNDDAAFHKVGIAGSNVLVPSYSIKSLQTTWSIWVLIKM